MRDRLNLSRLSIASVTDVGRSHAIRWLSPSISTSSIRDGEAADRGGIRGYRGDHRKGRAACMLFQTNCRGSIMTGRTEHIPPNFRRVVTGHDASGKPVIWIDGNASNHKFPSDNIPSTLMWSTDASPTQMLSNEDEGARILGSAPPANGSRFTMMEFQPGNAAHLHRTDTIDYVICVSGEIDMFLDELSPCRQIGKCYRA